MSNKDPYEITDICKHCKSAHPWCKKCCEVCKNQCNASQVCRKERNNMGTKTGKQGKLNGMGKTTELQKTSEKFVAEWEKMGDQKSNLKTAKDRMDVEMDKLIVEMEKVEKTSLEVKDSTGAKLRLRISATSSKKLKVKRL